MRSDRSPHILLAHGSGGKMTQELIESVFAGAFSNQVLDRMEDAATLDFQGRLACTIDSHVVSPIFFPGGDIGRLSVTGTVNDLAVAGATPLHLTAGFIIEEGFAVDDLRVIVESMRDAAREGGVEIIAGDTKVVEKGAADGVFITTCGIGIVPDGISISAAAAAPGDAVIVSGTIGDHGIAILGQRQGIEIATGLESDCAPLGGLVSDILAASQQVRTMRDPTRGGLAATLNEISRASGTAIEIAEDAIPYRTEVRSACELLGLDPLVLANEGKLVAIVAEQDAGAVLAAMRSNRYGRDAAIIGAVEAADSPRVYARTLLGSRRIISMPTGEQLPRIC
ncbi:MAG: hydrogenase expression/formation protein HypE [Thermoleophilia bacterium]